MEVVVAVFAPVPAGVLVDATVGGGGHSEALLESLANGGLRIIGLDRDAVAPAAAAERLAPFGDRVTLVQAPFSTLSEVDGRAAVRCAVRPGRELAPARRSSAWLFVPR